MNEDTCVPLVFLIHKKACDIIDWAGIEQGWENTNNSMRKCLCEGTFGCMGEMVSVQERRAPKCLDWTVVSNQAFLNLKSGLLDCLNE